MYGLSCDTIHMLSRYFDETACIFKVIIFGSRAKGNYKNNSDIDFAVIGEIDSFFLRKIKDGLNNLPLIYKFDVLDFKSITNEKLLSQIKNTGKIFYQRVKK